MRPKVGAKIELQREISQIGFKFTRYRLFSGVLQVAYRFLAVRDPYLRFSSEPDLRDGQLSQEIGASYAPSKR